MLFRSEILTEGGSRPSVSISITGIGEAKVTDDSDIIDVTPEENDDNEL